MERLFTDEFLEDSIKELLKSVGVNNALFSMARKMNVDLTELFYDKIVLNDSIQNREIVAKSLLGIYGNFIATLYFSGLGYEVENEVPVKDENGKATTYADLSFIDKTGRINYCEVKATTQILGSEKTYRDEDALLTFENKNDEIIKYTQIGKKLVKQAQKLSASNALVNVIIFEGCFVDEKIKEKLSALNVNIITLFPSIIELEKNIKEMVNLFSYKCKENLLIVSHNK